ncbi:MAG: tRNA preQ1(34) S-adenosylmethionine ribosyltransferase-isomerase QueA [Cyanobacteriota bacterium]|nr:tRNA preQ1(34) S-adenosylmethionine ribosyltransferase-isomerase QueA [Cyanobacteriota bacterium]
MPDFATPDSTDLLTESYHYDLPPHLIAQAPIHPRDAARLLVVHSDNHSHSTFRDLPLWLQPRDLLVLNDTQVIPARLYGHKQTGAKVEILLLEQQESDSWLALVKPGRRVRVGDRLTFAQGLQAQVMQTDPATGGRILQFFWPPDRLFREILQAIGEVPLPPYITERTSSPSDYQTLWACQPGSVAAPTAGLHFTADLLNALKARGILTATITLNIGLGTFRPVEVKHLQHHPMHAEWLQVPAATTEKIKQTQAQGGRIIAVGTTVVRALESAAQQGNLDPWQGKSQLFIYPGYRWRVVQGLITNFHLPRSSLLMLVSALIGRDRVLRLYAEAIEQQYRFFSFGDGMLILP